MKGTRVLTKTEVSLLLSTPNIRNRTMILTGLTFGTRISESLALTFGDVSGQHLRIQSSKKSNNEVFPIPEGYKDAVSELHWHYTDRGIKVTDVTPLFLSRKGYGQKSITRQQASQIIRKLCKEFGIEGKVNTHSLRKTFVTEIFERTGFNIFETKKYSRHKSLGNIEYYIGTTQERDLVNDLIWE